VRVIAGRLRGRRIGSPSGDLVRPTYDRVRESLFDILGSRVEGAAVLDLFAGTGALGIESLSRGAARATFVERDRRVAGALRDTLAELGVAGLAVVVTTDAARGVRGGLPGRPFDLVFVDPPYGSGLAALALDALSEAGTLAPGALVVVEHAAGDDPAETGALALERRERYGSTGLTFLAARGAQAAEDA
jgi:16S rRNA (guanine966-N2)-methyltransferase